MRALRSRRGRTPRVAIIGAGAGGLATGAYLRRAGVHSFTIYERAEGVGGVWRQNTYPGAACDVMSTLYSFSFAPKPDWSAAFAPQPEILAYLEDVATREGLRGHLRTRTAITSAAWSDESSTWTLGSDTGESFTADVVVSAVGLFTEPSLPDIPGLAGFRGRIVHSARWPPELDVAGARVGVIGTGASAVQLIPELAKAGADVTVFQRTPSWVMPKTDWARGGREERLPARLRERVRRARIFWGMEKLTVTRLDDPQIAEREAISRAYLAHKVPDEELRAALTPTIPFGCKRVLLASGYVSTLAAGAARLVTEPITEITPDGPRTGADELHELDTLVLATGFEASRYLQSLTVTGREGRDLHTEWDRNGVGSYLGLMVSGFPNFFMLYGPNTNQGGNSILFVLECGARFVRAATRELMRSGGRPLDVRAEAQTRYDEELHRDLRSSVWTACGSYFRDGAGRITTQWPHSALRYRSLTRRLQPSDFHRLRAPLPAYAQSQQSQEISCSRP